MLLRFAPLVPALLWIVLRLATRQRLRPGAWLGGAAGAAAIGVGTALVALAAEVTGREETKVTAELLYAALTAAGWNLGVGLVVLVVVVFAELALRGRPVGGVSTPAAWLIGLLASATAAWATWGAWRMIVRVGEVALMLEQRKAGLPGRFIDLRTLASELFSAGASAGVALVLALLTLGLAVAPAASEKR